MFFVQYYFNSVRNDHSSFFHFAPADGSPAVFSYPVTRNPEQKLKANG